MSRLDHLQHQTILALQPQHSFTLFTIFQGEFQPPGQSKNEVLYHAAVTAGLAFATADDTEYKNEEYVTLTMEYYEH